jgi:hypothetical protein
VTKLPTIYAIFKDYGKQESFRCDCCQRVLKKGWTDEDALDEMKENYGNIEASAIITLCDDCIATLKPRSWADDC